MDYIWNVKNKCNNLDELKHLFSKRYNRDINDLFTFKGLLRNPDELPNVQKASEKILQYIDKHKKILIYGDYDVDGITSVVCLFLALKYLNADVYWKIPLRNEGYGLSEEAVDKAKEDNIDVIVTVDNGIMCHEAIEYAKEKGIDVIVTDHHQLLKEDVPAEITVDPWIDSNIEFQDICGCMVVYKLIRKLIPDVVTLPLHNTLVAFTTIATIADMMPLKDENYSFVRIGLNYIQNTNNYGLNELLDKLKLKDRKIRASDISFSIAPVLNSAGRYADASLCIKLFLADDNFEPVNIVKKIIKFNDDRKELQKNVVDKIDVNPDDKFIIKKLDVPKGLTGVVATKLSNIYQKPCIIFNENDDTCAGSGRSPEYFNISELFKDERISGGGHKGACGISIDKDNFEWFVDYANKQVKNIEIKKPIINVFADISTLYENRDILNEFVDIVHSFEPFGIGNKEPEFLIKNMQVSDYKILGKTENTVKFVTYYLDAIAFNEVKDKYMNMNCPKNIDVVCKVSYNEWAGRKTIQLTITDLKEAS